MVMGNDKMEWNQKLTLLASALALVWEMKRIWGREEKGHT